MLLSSATAPTPGKGKVLKRVKVAKKTGDGGGSSGGSGGGGGRSWRDRLWPFGKKNAPKPEGLVTGRQLAKAFGAATAFQFAWGCLLVGTEATFEKMDGVDQPPQEAMAAGLVLGMGASGFLFRAAMKPLWAKARWYVALLFMNLQVIPAANLFVRTALVPDLPIIEPDELKALAATAAALGVKALGYGTAEDAADGGEAVALTVQEALLGWQQLFYMLSGGREGILLPLLPAAAMAAKETASPHVVEASGLQDLLFFLAEPANGALLRGAFRVGAAGSGQAEGVTLAQFATLMVAAQAAAEGNEAAQCELLFPGRH